MSEKIVLRADAPVFVPLSLRAGPTSATKTKLHKETLALSARQNHGGETQRKLRKQGPKGSGGNRHQVSATPGSSYAVDIEIEQTDEHKISQQPSQNLCNSHSPKQNGQQKNLESRKGRGQGRLSPKSHDGNLRNKQISSRRRHRHHQKNIRLGQGRHKYKKNSDAETRRVVEQHDKVETVHLPTETPALSWEHNTQQQLTGCWSQQTAAERIKEAICLQHQPRAPQEDEETSKPGSSLPLQYGNTAEPLTLLSPLSRKKPEQRKTKATTKRTETPNPQPAEDAASLSNTASGSENSRLEGSTPPLPIETTSGPVLKRRQFDMTRLRDRWWDLLKNLPAPQPESEIIRSKVDRNGDDSESDSSALSLVPTGHPSRNQSSVKEPTAISLMNLPDSPYFGCRFPIHRAIRRGDEEVLRILLQSNHPVDLGSGSGRIEYESPTELAVELGRPHLLQIILAFMSQSHSTQQIGKKYSSFSSRSKPAIHTAVERGDDECVNILLDHQLSILLLKDNDNEDNPLHLACRPNASRNILPDCLKRIDSTFMAKVMSQKNKNGQTPLHVACASGRVDLVEAILSHCSYSLLSRLLSVQDNEWQTPLLAAVAAGSTDVVMSLLMWKGNNHKHIQEGGGKGHCALSCAVRARDVEMTLLLLEFSDSSSMMPSLPQPKKSSDAAGYNLTHALYLACNMVEKQHAICDTKQLELVRVLVDAGANPCSVETPSGKTCLLVVTGAHQEQLVQLLLRTYSNYQTRVQTNRRRDPLLQKQPESFFTGLEQRENSERVTAIRRAILVALFSGWTNSSLSVQFYSCAVALYQGGVGLDDDSLERLMSALQNNDESSLFDTCIVSRAHAITLEASYSHPTGDFNTDTSANVNPNLYWAAVMSQARWCADEESVSCEHLRSLIKNKDLSSIAFPGNLELTSTDGEKFLVHSAVIRAKSPRIEAAVRFEEMKLGSDVAHAHELVALQLPVNSRLCRCFLENIYCGSIVSFPKVCHDKDLCHELLNLLNFAEEYLCSSLAQEVEMRLLSPYPRRCICCQCSLHPFGNNAGMSTCSYVQTGTSVCIRPDTVLDLFAESLRFEGEGHGIEYNILVSIDELARPSWSSPDSTERRVLPAVEYLRGTISLYILREFCFVTRADSFGLHFDGGLSQRESTPFLLHTCLDKIAAIPPLSTKQPGSIRAQSGNSHKCT